MNNEIFCSDICRRKWQSNCWKTQKSTSRTKSKQRTKVVICWLQSEYMMSRKLQLKLDMKIKNFDWAKCLRMKCRQYSSYNVIRHPVSSSYVSDLLLRVVRGEWPDWLELRKAQITTLYNVVSQNASQYTQHAKRWGGWRGDHIGFQSFWNTQTSINNRAAVRVTEITPHAPHFLMYDVNINPSYWPLSTWFCTLHSYHMIGWLNNWKNELR